MEPSILTALINAGPTGIVAVVLIWIQQSGKAERLAYDKDRLETDKAIAAVLSSIKTTLESLGRK